MEILVYGAGVLGSLYAARLHAAGHRMTILARGPRLAELRTHGIVLEEARTGVRSAYRVPVVGRLDPGDAYDLVIVLVRWDQVASVLPALAASAPTPTVLFMASTPRGGADWVEALGPGRVVLGFAGAGGLRIGRAVRYQILARWQQPTTIGEPGGTDTPRLRRIARALGEAGFPVATSPRMGAWLRTHVAWTLPLSTALYMAGGDAPRLARTRDALVLLVRAVREDFRVLRAAGVPITPGSLHVFDRMPEPLLVAVLGRLLATPTARIVIAGHANAARDEYRAIADDWLALARAAGIPTPALGELCRSLDQACPPMAEGRADLPLARRGIAIGMAVLIGAGGALVGLRALLPRRGQADEPSHTARPGRGMP